MATNDLLPAAIATTGAAAAAAIPQLVPTNVAIQRDRFAKRAGADVSIKRSSGVTEVYAVFSVDPTSKRLQVAVVDGEGRVLRMIPPGSVAQMMETMGRYKPM